MKNRFVALMLGVLLAATAHAQVIQFAVAGKRQRFDQMGDGIGNVSFGLDPWQLQTRVIGGNVSASFPTPPNDVITAGGSSTPFVGLEFDPIEGSWQEDGNLTTHFSSQAALDSSFANGIYTFDLNNHTANSTVTLTGDFYPNIPFGTFSQGTWIGGTLYVDPSQSLTITTNVFSANFTPGQGRIEIALDDGTSVDNGPGFTANSLSLNITAGTLIPGTTYFADVEFDTIVDMAPLLGGTSVAVYATHTEFQIYAIPEPSTTALIASAAALGCVLWRRRRTR